MTRRSVALPLLLAIVLAACGASARETTIRTTYHATVAAQAGFLVFDKQHEANIVAASRETGLEAGKAALAAYRLKSDRIVQLFEITWRALAAAAALNDDPRSLANLLEAWKQLSLALKEASGGKLP